VTADGPALNVAVEVPLTGEYLFCVATPENAVPTVWEPAGAKRLHDGAFFKDSEAPTCCICLESVLDSTDGHCRPVILECKHHFHEQCIRRMLRGTLGSYGNTRCPLCRQEVVLEADGLVGGLTKLQFTLTRDTTSQPFVPGASYLIGCLMAADDGLPVESYSSAAFLLYRPTAAAK